MNLRCVSKNSMKAPTNGEYKRKQRNAPFVDNEQEWQWSINLRAHDTTKQSKGENGSNFTIIPDNNQIIRYYCTNFKLRRQKRGKGAV